MTAISAVLEDGYAVTITSGSGHTFASDEPTTSGGSDTGPNPYELLLGALASCTAITLAMYCERKGWELDGIEVAFEHDRIHADDCLECDDDRSGYVDRMRGKITLRGDFDEAQRARLTQVAGRCPISKTLGNNAMVTEEVTFA